MLILPYLVALMHWRVIELPAPSKSLPSPFFPVLPGFFPDEDGTSGSR
jgi:hypothetical protein